MLGVDPMLWSGHPSKRLQLAHAVVWWCVGKGVSDSRSLQDASSPKNCRINGTCRNTRMAMLITRLTMLITRIVNHTNDKAYYY